MNPVPYTFAGGLNITTYAPPPLQTRDDLDLHPLRVRAAYLSDQLAQITAPHDPEQRLQEECRASAYIEQILPSHGSAYTNHQNLYTFIGGQLADQPTRATLADTVTWQGWLKLGLSEADAGWLRTCAVRIRAHYPVAPGQPLIDVWEALQAWIDTKERLDLVDIGIIHAQFELIHPFRDGNGRIGRFLAWHQLISERHIPYPGIPLSKAIADTRLDYYQALATLEQGATFEPFITYWLDQIEHTINTINQP